MEAHDVEGPVERWRARARTGHLSQGSSGAERSFSITARTSSTQAFADAPRRISAADDLASEARSTRSSVSWCGGFVTLCDDPASRRLAGGEGHSCVLVWLADNWPTGSQRDAEALFEMLLAVRNDVGLSLKNTTREHGFSSAIFRRLVARRVDQYRAQPSRRRSRPGSIAAESHRQTAPQDRRTKGAAAENFTPDDGARTSVRCHATSKPSINTMSGVEANFVPARRIPLQKTPQDRAR